MKAEIFIVTFQRDFVYLYYCLRSIAKFFIEPSVHILVPTPDIEGLKVLVDKVQLPVRISGFDEWPRQGMIHHMYQIITADKWCPDAEFIIHFDADCIFTEPISAETYIPEGRPILRYESFESIGKRHPGVFDKWRDTCNACLPFDCKYEAMRCHPLVYHRGVYWLTRQLMQEKVDDSPENYIRKQQNSYPQGFCEFNTLGNVALEMFPKFYKKVEQGSDKTSPPNHVIQFWSHGPIDQPQHIWLNGEQQKVVPLEKINSILG